MLMLIAISDTRQSDADMIQKLLQTFGGIEREHCFHAAVAYALLLDLGVNFFRSVLSSKWQENSAWLDSQMLRSLHNTAAQAINQLAVFHDKYLSAKDPFLTLKVKREDLSMSACVISSPLLSMTVERSAGWHLLAPAIMSE